MIGPPVVRTGRAIIYHTYETKENKSVDKLTIARIELNTENTKDIAKLQFELDRKLAQTGGDHVLDRWTAKRDLVAELATSATTFLGDSVSSQVHAGDILLSHVSGYLDCSCRSSSPA